MNELNETQFTCQQCNQPYRYEQAASHFKICNAQKFQCECGQQLDEHVLSKHLEEECKEVEGQCETCMRTMKRHEHEIQSHDCFEGLQITVGELTSLIQELRLRDQEKDVALAGMRNTL